MQVCVSLKVWSQAQSYRVEAHPIPWVSSAIFDFTGPFLIDRLCMCYGCVHVLFWLFFLRIVSVWLMLFYLHTDAAHILTSFKKKSPHEEEMLICKRFDICMYFYCFILGFQPCEFHDVLMSHVHLLTTTKDVDFHTQCCDRCHRQTFFSTVGMVNRESFLSGWMLESSQTKEMTMNDGIYNKDIWYE